MYLNDSPINDKKDDLLGRSIFVNNLARSIVDNKSKDTFCIGIYGKWGSGKTSIINMFKQEIGSMYEVDPNNEKPVLISFNPWNFSCNEHLLKQFFIRVYNELSSSKDRKLGKVGTAIKKYSFALEFSNYLPIPAYAAKLITTAGKKGAEIVGDKLESYSLSKSDDIFLQKEKVIKLLNEQERKIIVIIDDIDRLSNEEIRLVFKLINSVANFPNVIYLLSFDKDIVVKALEKVQEGNGNEYLEKIIQIPISLPEVKKEKINIVLFNKLDELLEISGAKFFEQSYWQSAFPKCIEPFINNLRDVNRLYNVISFKLNSISSETNFVDIVAISTIETFCPQIYQWIKDNRGILVGDPWANIFNDQKSKEEWYKHYLEIFKSLLKDNRPGSINKENIIEALICMFPNLGKLVGKHYAGLDQGELRKNKRMAHSEKFDLYFTLDINDVVIPSAEIENALLYMSEEDFKDYLISLDRENKTIYFLDETRSYIEKINPQRAESIITILMQTAIKFESKNTGFIALSPLTKSEHIIESLFTRMNKPDRFALLELILLKADADCISCFASFLNTLELAFGRLAANGQERLEYEKLIELSELESLEKLFIQKIKLLSKNTNLLDFKYSLMVTYLLESLDPEFYEGYFNKEYFKDKLNVLKFLELSAAKWRGRTYSWEINDSYKKHLSDKVILDSIKQALADKSFWNLTEKTRNIAATFYLLKNQGEKANREIEQKQIDGILQEWEKQ
ncbi:MAG: hypothetical protein GX451_04235 [Acholeplasmataceae bacterium]|nr:hypothetical protein [Acholeplasmataceae bacterium]